MTDIIRAAPVTGDVFVRNMRKVLAEEGFAGEALESKIRELMHKDASRVAAVILAPRESR